MYILITCSTKNKKEKCIDSKLIVGTFKLKNTKFKNILPTLVSAPLGLFSAHYTKKRVHLFIDVILIPKG